MDLPRTGDEDLPQALVDGLNQGLASGDWDEVLDLFADHGTLVVDLGSRTSFEGQEGIREALEGLREDFGGVQYAPDPLPREDAEDVVTDLLSASGPDAPSARVHLDLTSDEKVSEAVLELEDPPDPEPSD